jgi:transcriptional regulator with XRE-family HTH domain
MSQWTATPISANRWHMERAGLSQRQLAFSGCSAAYISRLEAGERVAAPEVLRELASRLGVSPKYLADGGAAASARLDDAELERALGNNENASRVLVEALADAHDEPTRRRMLVNLGQAAVRRSVISPRNERSVPCADGRFCRQHM